MWRYKILICLFPPFTFALVMINDIWQLGWDRYIYTLCMTGCIFSMLLLIGMNDENM